MLIHLNEEIYLMWLTRITGIGAKKQRLLLHAFGSAENVYFTRPADLIKIHSLNDELVENIIKAKLNSKLEDFATELYQSDMKFISFWHPLYPDILKEIPDPPIGLYAIGDTSLLQSEVSVGIVGSRYSSEYGRMAAYKISADLAKKGVTIISGMAKGIDTSAHKGALEADGKTIAVLGCGADVCYPKENKIVYNKIAQHGLILSEHPPGTAPLPGFFPMRNRIISGLSNGVFVVEAGEKSGSLITADQALEQGRDVYALPGSIYSKLSKGSNNLIKQGALLVTQYEDILDALGFFEKKQEVDLEAKTKDLANDEMLVYDCISFEPISIDTLLEKLDLELQQLQYLLTMLELKKYIERLPGGRYILI